MKSGALIKTPKGQKVAFGEGKRSDKGMRKDPLCCGKTDFDILKFC